VRMQDRTGRGEATRVYARPFKSLVLFDNQHQADEMSSLHIVHIASTLTFPGVLPQDQTSHRVALGATTNQGKPATD
jgi:hypothetical protein